VTAVNKHLSTIVFECKVYQHVEVSTDDEDAFAEPLVAAAEKDKRKE